MDIIEQAEIVESKMPKFRDAGPSKCIICKVPHHPSLLEDGKCIECWSLIEGAGQIREVENGDTWNF